MIFATNRGEVARLAGEPPGGDPDTMVVWDGSRRLVRSQAAVRALLSALGGGCAWASGFVAGCSPVSWLDFVYDQCSPGGVIASRDRPPVRA
jgi:hypothetical protein